LAAHDVAGGGVENGGCLLTLQGLEGVGSEAVGDTYYLSVSIDGGLGGVGLRVANVPENAR
jgi:hypothetical protein